MKNEDNEVAAAVEEREDCGSFRGVMYRELCRQECLDLLS
jgi:hypothetical protein